MYIFFFSYGFSLFLLFHVFFVVAFCTCTCIIIIIIIIIINYSKLLSSTPDTCSKALLLSSSIPHAGDWLGVFPSPNLGLHLLDCEFRLCLRYWLGVQLASDTIDCPFCSRPADVLGDHALACGGNTERISRHNALRDVVFSAAQAAALSPRREVPFLVPDSLSRPADVFLPSWHQGRPAALDTTVISSL